MTRLIGIGAGLGFLFVGMFNPALTMNQAIGFFIISALFFISAGLNNSNKGSGG